MTCALQAFVSVLNYPVVTRNGRLQLFVYISDAMVNSYTQQSILPPTPKTLLMTQSTPSLHSG